MAQFISYETDILANDRLIQEVETDILNTKAELAKMSQEDEEIF